MEQQGEFAEDGVIMKFSEVVRNYCEDAKRWKWSIEDVSRLIFMEKIVVYLVLVLKVGNQEIRASEVWCNWLVGLIT